MALKIKTNTVAYGFNFVLNILFLFFCMGSTYPWYKIQEVSKVLSENEVTSTLPKPNSSPL